MRHITNFTLVILALLSWGLSYGQISITYTSNAQSPFVVPVGVTEITVECWGAGGGGGRSTSTSNGRGGGGGGAYARSVLSVTPGQSLPFTIGAGGTGGNLSAAANSGGSTNFGSGLVIAVGGGGVNNNTNTAGLGGLASACTFNDVAYSGGNGSDGSGGNRGAGGGGAGSNGPGGNASGITAGEGAAQLGGNGGAGATGGGAGNAGANYGGGGGGARATTLIFTVNQNGGNGAPGAIRITYMPPNCSGQPNAGTASININAGCDNQNFNLSATGLTSPADFEGISYQWKRSTDNGVTWENISGATNATFTTTAAVNTLYRLETTCSFSGQTNLTNTVSRTVNCWTLPQNTVVTTCGGNFFDSGGSGANYGNNQNYTYTFFPANPGEFVTLTFTQFATQSSTCSFDRDWLRIFNGASTAAPALHPTPSGCVAGFMTGQSTMPGFPFTITSTAPDGSLTVQFKSDGSTVAAGWAAQIGCAPACSGTPNAGTASISSSSGCPPMNLTLSATNLSVNPGVTYQWESAPTSSGPWIAIAGATSPISSTNASTTTFYRLRSTCTNTGQSNFSNTVSYTSSGACCNTYPIFAATSATDSEISSVTVGSMTNTSTCSTLAPGPGSILNRYSNYSGIVQGPSANPGQSVNFSFTQTTCGDAWTNIFQLYVDWNQNGIFEVSERMYNQPSGTSGNHTKSGSFTVPLTAIPGTTRMRVVCVESNASSTNFAMQNYSWGETEDYCFTVLGTPPPAADFISSWFSMDTGSPQWCPNETRTVSVTVTNNGSLPWTDAPGNDFNIGVKWNFESDYFVRVDAENLAPGQAKTYFLTVTAPNNPGGTENLRFDVVKEGCFWFAMNSDGCSLNTVGPGNTEFISAPISIKFDPLNVSAGSPLQLCPGTTGQLLATATSPTIVTSSSTTNPPDVHSPTELVASPTINTESSCPLDLSVTIPPGAVITGVNITYTMENTNLFGLTTNEQRSYLECVSPGGIKEASLASGTFTGIFNPGTVQTYTRNNLDIANGVQGGGTIDFRLHGFRTTGGTGCATNHRINQGSVLLTINYSYQPELEYSWSPSSFLSASNIADPMVTPPFGTTSYTLNVGVEGCSVSSSTSVQVGNFGCTQLGANSCNATDVALNQGLFASLVGAPAYRFRIVGPNNANWVNNTVILDRTVRWFSFNPHITGEIAGQTYTVEVAVGDGNGNFGPYGLPCSVTLSTALPTTQLVVNACNAVNVMTNTALFANQIPEAQGYLFRIVGPNNGNQAWDADTILVTRPVRWFQFNQHVPGSIQGATYEIRVAYLTNDGVTYSPFGPVCSVSLFAPLEKPINTNNDIFVDNKTMNVVDFGANASHNPFTTDFGIQVLNANDVETINVSVYDMSGKLIERSAVNPMDIESARFGANLASGMYMIEVRQGSNQAVIRQVKN